MTDQLTDADRQAAETAKLKGVIGAIVARWGQTDFYRGNFDAREIELALADGVRVDFDKIGGVVVSVGES